MNALETSSSDIRIPLFDKESSDFCFEKSREILSRPLQFGSRSSFTAPTPPPSLEYTDAITQSPRKDKKSLSENLLDIENTLKALNLDFMHTYTDVDKNDSDETILNDQFSSIVSSLDDEISSATGSLNSATVYNYQNGKHTTTTTFDFNAATNHLDKHLQLMSSQAQMSSGTNNINNNSNSNSNKQQQLQQQQSSHDKRSSTPDTGFASRDTISLSRRSSQKSSYSPQDSYFSPKDLSFPSPSMLGSSGAGNGSGGSGGGGGYANYKTEVFKYGDDSLVSPFRSVSGMHKSSNTSIYSPNQLRIDEHSDNYNGMHEQQRRRSMSFTDNLDRDAASSMRDKRSNKTKQLSLDPQDIQQKPKGSSYKSRSVRARTLRRLSYNPMPQVATSSSSTDEESDIERTIARSECDIRSRTSGSGSLYHPRRRRQGYNRKVFSESIQDDRDDVHARKSKMYGSNASIKSAPHYNYGGGGGASSGVGAIRNTGLGSSQRPYNRNPYEESYPYEERLYDFGGSKPSKKSFNAPVLSKPPKTFKVSGLTNNSGSGSSSASSAATPFSRNVIGNSSVFQEFDVTRLTGRSPPSAFNDNQQHDHAAATTEFQWPEKIHASTVKQNDMLWRQQQQLPSIATSSINHSSYGAAAAKDHPSSTLSSSTTDSDQFEYRMGYSAPHHHHLPPSPAP